jgi:hypothetical protein
MEKTGARLSPRSAALLNRRTAASATINVWKWFINVDQFLAVRRGGNVEKQCFNQKEDSRMSRRVIVAMLGLGLAMFLMPQVLLAAEDHIAEAITHTKQAIDHGKMGHADVLPTHAEAALTHAEAGEKAKANKLRVPPALPGWQ